MATDEAAADGMARPARAAGSAGPRRGWRMLRLGVAVTFVAKVAALGWGYGELPAFLTTARAEAVATDAKTAAGAPPSHGAVDAPARAAADAGRTDRPPDERAAKAPDVRALVEAITRRQSELDVREREIADREERLRVFEQDVTAKVASLEEIEKRLQVRAKSATAAIDAAAESLAKVYGAMKPAEAAPILERLDEPTVLTIFARMKEKQIGEILPLMSKEKAITLTQQLAASAGR